MVTAADLVIQDLALELAVMTARAIEAETDRAAQRVLLCAAFDALREAVLDRDRVRRQHDELRDEYRALREHVLLVAGVEV